MNLPGRFVFILSYGNVVGEEERQDPIFIYLFLFEKYNWNFGDASREADERSSSLFAKETKLVEHASFVFVTNLSSFGAVG